MKLFIILVFNFVFFGSIFSQSQSNKVEVVSIIKQRSIYLNGGARASVGGKSRVLIPVDLPEGTTSWFYSFSTTPGENGIKDLKLFAQLASISQDPIGISKSIISNIEVPEGSAGIDIYLLDRDNSDLFLQKVDNDGGRIYHFRDQSVVNTKQAIVDISKLNKGTFYLGLKNPSMWNGVNVIIEVVALVKKNEEK